MDTIRVALAEDNVLLREGVSRLVASNDDFELVGTASDLPQLLALVGAERPDVVITDIRMPPTGTNEGIQAAGWLRENHPDVGVVVLSQYTAPGYAMALLEHGSAGRAYLLKERVASVDELARAIRAVAGGGSVIDPMVVDELVRSRSAHQQSSLAQLTPRETEILAEMAQGKSNAAIALYPDRVRAGGGKAHQLDLRQARAERGEGPEPAGQGGAALPGRHPGKLTHRPRGWQHPRPAGRPVASLNHDHPARSGRGRRPGTVPDGRPGRAAQNRLF